MTIVLILWNFNEIRHLRSPRVSVRLHPVPTPIVGNSVGNSSLARDPNHDVH